MGRPSIASAPRSGVLLSFAAMATFGIPREAQADPTKAQCIEADTAAQNERRAEQFHAAREHLQACSSAACPALVREDCIQRLGDLESVTPTLVFAAKDAGGDDVVGVRVTVDGAAVSAELSGAPVAMDPGVHGFTFTVKGASPVVKTFVVREGERDRLEHIVFTDLHVPPGGAVVYTPPASAGASNSSWNNQKTAAVVVGATGALGVIIGAVTGGLSFGSWSSSQSDCGTTSGVCINRAQALSDRSSAETYATVSDVGFIAGSLLLATGVVVYLAAPSRSSARGSITFAPAVASGGGSMQLMGSF